MQVPGVVIDSVVVPIVSNVRLYGQVGRSVHADRVPMVLLATGSSLRSGRRKCTSKTSSCLAGPFDTGLLRDHVGGLLRAHGGVTSLLTLTSARPGRRDTIDSLGGLSGRFLRGVARVVRRGLRVRGVSVTFVTSGVYVDRSALCHGVGKLASVSTGRFVHGMGVHGKIRLLVSKRCAVSRVTCVVKFDDITCFHRYFGSRCKVSPSSCIGRGR